MSAEKIDTTPTPDETVEVVEVKKPDGIFIPITKKTAALMAGASAIAGAVLGAAIMHKRDEDEDDSDNVTFTSDDPLVKELSLSDPDTN